MSTLRDIVLSAAALGICQCGAYIFNKEVNHPHYLIDNDRPLNFIVRGGIGIAVYLGAFALSYLTEYLPDAIINNRLANNYGVLAATLLTGGAAAYLYNKYDPTCKGYKFIIPTLMTIMICYLGFTKTNFNPLT